MVSEEVLWPFGVWSLEDKLFAFNVELNVEEKIILISI